MAAILRRMLQRDLFQADNDSIITVMQAVKLKKKKEVYLCITISSTTHPTVVKIHEVTASEKIKGYKIKSKWELRELRSVDGINPRKATPEFELTFSDKAVPQRYQAGQVTEKDAFLRQLFNLSETHSANQKPEFINFKLPVDDMEYAYQQNRSNAQKAVNVMENGSHGTGDNNSSILNAIEEHDSEHPLISSKEENDFRRLLQKCNLSLADADRFSKTLTKQLSLMDGANMQAIMGSECQVNELMGVIDLAIGEAEKLEEKLDKYDEILMTVRESVEMMEEKDSLFHIQQNNRLDLQNTLQTFMTSLYISEEQKRILKEANLSDLGSINRCTQAALSLQKCFTNKHPKHMESMKAHRQQLIKLELVRDQFAEGLGVHLNQLFMQFARPEEVAESSQTLPKHTSIHQALIPYSELVMWLKVACPDGHSRLLDSYKLKFREVYKCEVQVFFSKLVNSMAPAAFDRKTSTMSLKRGSHLRDLKQIPRSTSGEFSGLSAIELDSASEQTFDTIFERLINQFEPVVISEQKFCLRFFHISSDLLAACETSSIASKESDSLSPEKRSEKQTNDEVTRVMKDLFEELNSQLDEFVMHADRVNHYYSMFILARIYDETMRFANDNSYVSRYLLGAITVNSKRNVSRFFDNQVRQVQEFKLAKRGKVGILPFVHQFETIATQGETAFKNTERRSDIDNCYTKLIIAVFEGIDRISNDPNSKAPPAMVQMENYHRISSCLAQLKISHLASQRKAAHSRYQSELDLYAKECMGKPMEKLSAFFEEIERNKGLKPEEVSYQMKFSKQILLKLIKEYPPKEVKKGLDLLYLDVQKKLCPEENLLQVVWYKMQDEFIQQYKHFDSMIAQCYPNSNVRMEFTIEEILSFFSDIAQRH